MTPTLRNKSNKKSHAHVIVTSDTCHANKHQDTSGKIVCQRLIATGLFANVGKSIVADNYDDIIECVKTTLVDYDCSLIVTVGGTGLCARDVTPEATSSLYDKHCSGLVAALHRASLKSTPFAALSRLSAGIVSNCLVINFPGSEKACNDCLDCLLGFLGHALEQVRFDAAAISKTHANMLGAHNKSNSSYCLEQSHLNGDNQQINGLDESNSSMYCNVGTPQQKQPGRGQRHDQQRQHQQNHNEDSQMRSSASTRFPLGSGNKSKSVMNEVLGCAQRVLPESQAGIGTSSEMLAQRISQIKVESQVIPKSRTQQPVVSGLARKSKVNSMCQKSANSQTSTKPKGQVQVQKTLLKESPYPMVGYEEALDILKRFSPNLMNTELYHKFDLLTQSTANRALYHVLAEDLRPKALLPPHDVSTMDGYVVALPKSLWQFCNKFSNNLKCIQAHLLANVNEMDGLDIEAVYNSSHELYCYQVNTGGQLPTKCNYCIVPTEKAEQSSDKMIFLSDVESGAYIRKAGSDLNGQDVLKRGTVIGPVELSLILAMGHRSVRVWRRPRIGILSTGDELVGPYTPFGVCRDSVIDVNAPLLTTLLGMYKYPAVQFGIVRDNPDEIAEKFRLACNNCDILIVTGGASMGSKDWVKTVIEKQLHGKLHFGRVNMKPGKPVSFATVKRGDGFVPIFSLPGNPVSAYITALVLVLPFLEHGVKHHFDRKAPLDLTAIGDLIQVEVRNILDGDDSYNFDGRLEFARAKILGPCSADSKFPVSVSMKQQSSRLLSLRDFDCLIMVGSSRKGASFSIGDTYWACLLSRVM